MQRLQFTTGATDMLPAHTITCYAWGESDAKHTVFCVHGLTRNGRDFDFLAQALENDFRVICPDMAGRGESERLQNPALYAYPTYITDCKFILDSLQLSKVHWVGTSMGGMAGMMMAATFPGLLQSLTLNDVGCLIPATALKRIFGYAGAKTEFASRAEAEAVLRKNASTFGLKTDAQWQHFFDITIVEKNGTFLFACDPAIAAGFPKPEDVKDVDLWGFWQAMTKLPVLLVRGAQSDILPEKVAQEMQEKHPALTLYEVEGAGHAPALMDEQDIAFVKQWLKTTQPL